MITFMCVHCNEELKVPDNTAGKRGKCPHCGKVVQIPMQAAPLEAVVEPEPATFAMAPPAAPPSLPTPAPAAVSVTPMPEFKAPPPALGEPPAAYAPPADEPASGSLFAQPGIEFAVGSIILGLGSMLLSANCLLIAAVSITRVTLFLWWLSVTGVGAFGVVLAVFGMKVPRPRAAPGHWYLLVGIVLNGAALLLALVIFLVILTAPDVMSGPQPRMKGPF